MRQFKVVPDESILLDLTPEDVAFLFFYLAIAISRSLTIDELNLLANGLFETAQVLFTIASQRTFIDDVIEKQQEEQKKQAEAKKQEQSDSAEEPTSTRELRPLIIKLQSQMEQMQQEIDKLKKQQAGG